MEAPAAKVARAADSVVLEVPEVLEDPEAAPVGPEDLVRVALAADPADREVPGVVASEDLEVPAAEQGARAEPVVVSEEAVAKAARAADSAARAGRADLVVGSVVLAAKADWVDLVAASAVLEVPGALVFRVVREET